MTRVETLANLSALAEIRVEGGGCGSGCMLANRVDLERGGLASAGVEATDELRDHSLVMASGETRNGVEATFQGLANLIRSVRGIGPGTAGRINPTSKATDSRFR